jgi:uncharacterized oxidoreductase
LAAQFIKHGSTVIICGRSEGKLLTAKDKYPQLIPYVCDVAHPDERAAMFDWVSETYPMLNVLVNNAGIQRRSRQIWLEQVWEAVSEELTINLEAPIHLSILFIPFLEKQKHPAIINVTSGLAFTPIAGASVYSASKAALHSFTLSLRQQLIDTPIKVMEIIPPSVNTDLGGKGLHTSGADVDEFTTAVLRQLADGKLEAAYGSAAESSRASSEQLDALFQRMNQRR